MYKVSKILLRNILNSAGLYSIEAEVVLESGETGVASAPMAIKGGSREQIITKEIYKKISFYNEQIQILIGNYQNQSVWDEKLKKYIVIWGTDITLSLSLAFARAVAMKLRLHLTDYMQILGNIRKIEKRKVYLIPIFSGGVHCKGEFQSIQQIMFAIDSYDFKDTLYEILEFYENLERKISESGWLTGYSASSGFIVKELSVNEQLSLLMEEIQKSEFCNHLSVALDVASEHLKNKNGYRFYGENLTNEKMEETLIKFTENYPITYLEDPFSYEDREHWVSLRNRIKEDCHIFSDDLTATQVQYIDRDCADGAIIKMKQVGTLTATLEMSEKLKEHGMIRCVSHRSYETEDTFMCDLGVATNAEYMKIGGPRRGDRVSKYNQLLRIFSRGEI